MNVLLISSYPGTKIKEVIQVFTSPDLPPRPDFVKEVGSIGYVDAMGPHTAFILEVPDDKVGEYLNAQRKRTVFMISRVEELNIETYFGVDVAKGVPEGLGLLPT